MLARLSVLTRRTLAAPALALVLFALSLTAPPSARAQDDGAEAAAVRERVSAFLDAMIAVDIDAYVACLPPERRERLTSNQRAAMARLLELNQSGDAAMVSYELGAIDPDPDGSPTPSAVEVEVTVTGKNNAQTRYVAHCLNEDDTWFVDSLEQRADDNDED